MKRDGTAAAPRKKWRVVLGRLFRWGCCFLLLVALVVLFWLRGALYDHFVRFPQEEAAWRALRAERQAVTNLAGWPEYRGILHSHSHLSHDSEMPFEDILKALDVAGLDFIGLSDHCTDGRADFNAQWRGLHGGKLFIPGFEMRDGVMPFGVAAGVVLSNRTELSLLARQIVSNGGVLFFAHPEEPRAWELPELTGMEIYNIHSDLKQLRGGLPGLLPQVLVNLRRYPDHVYRKLFRRPTPFLQRWDELNLTRHITGTAGNDCHQNVGVRALYTAADTIRIEDPSPQVLAEFSLNWLTRPLARLLFGRLEANRKLFHLQLDPYERSARFVNTHVLAHELSEAAVLEALRAGRVFIGFDMIADSSGFRWFADNGTERAVMGEALPFTTATRLHALSPLPGRFSIWRNGVLLQQQEGRRWEWTPSRPGKYRVEVEVKIGSEWVPWVYANPIELK
ncbi:MAG TPA: hypothetical protein PKN95_06300 [Verrucomicrobiota bacterium]|nr:hypothetical protein [Verrucomicrobiota bacterium]HNT15589.1 hypothetical protein [Verrucomicrobiota bacterium]